MYNTLDDAVELIKKSRNIMILTGAGISKHALLSASVPVYLADFYATLQVSPVESQTSAPGTACMPSSRRRASMILMIPNRCTPTRVPLDPLYYVA